MDFLNIDLSKLSSSKILYKLEDFNQTNTHEDILLSAIVYFVILWLIEWSSYALFSCFSGEVFAGKRNKTILARHTMDFVSMAVFSYVGVVAIMDLGGLDIYSGVFTYKGKALAIGYDRIYQYLPSAQRLITMHIAYETKNFCDSVIHNDGLLFLVHHTCTLILCVSQSRQFFYFIKNIFIHSF